MSFKRSSYFNAKPIFIGITAILSLLISHPGQATTNASVLTIPVKLVAPEAAASRKSSSIPSILKPKPEKTSKGSKKPSDSPNQHRIITPKEPSFSNRAALSISLEIMV